jgi:hypothetical protein
MRISPRAALFAQSCFTATALALSYSFLPGIAPESTAAKLNFADENDSVFQINEEKGLELVTANRSVYSHAATPAKPPTIAAVWRSHWRSLCSVALYGGLLFISRTARDLLLPLVRLVAKPCHLIVLSF